MATNDLTRPDGRWEGWKIGHMSDNQPSKSSTLPNGLNSAPKLKCSRNNRLFIGRGGVWYNKSLSALFSISATNKQGVTMKPLPIGIHTFERIRTEDWLYVDKTRYIYDLITTGSVYFLSRPRRFGKSLLVSTLQAIFEGKRDLFAGLWLAEQSDYAFEPYHVLSLDMSKVRAENPEQLKADLMFKIDSWAERFGVSLKHPHYSGRFGELIEKLGQEKRVVILIDEYDKPILDHLTKPTRDDIKDTLKGFYTTIKASDPYLRFVLLTGVTKFSKISVFSGFNNLEDISMVPAYAPMLGITQPELEAAFADHLQRLVEATKLSYQATLRKVKQWYNGYRFSDEALYVYNPFSLLLLLKHHQFKFHWFETGTPTFLLELMKNNPQSWRQIPDEKWVSERSFSSYEVERLQSLPLLFQSGYLTIRDIDDEYEERLYLLDYPNFEVKKGFLSEVIEHFSEITGEESYILRMTQFFKRGDIDNVLEELKIFFANVPYDLQLKNEKYYQSIFFAIFQLLGFNIEAEIKTNRGRIDVAVDMPEMIYLFEFKLFGSKEEALAQIKSLQYFQKYLNQSKPVTLIGVEFDQTERNIGDWLIEAASPPR